MRFLPTTMPAFVAAIGNAPNAELIVVDNGSRDGSWEFISSFGSRLVALQLPRVNVGAVRNAGVARSSGDLICFLDADCLVEEDYVVRVRESAREHGGDVFGSRYRLPANPCWIERTWHRLHERPPGARISYINGGNLVVSRRAWTSTSGFDPALPSGEDAALCAALAATGYPPCEDPRVKAFHLGNPKSLAAFFRQQHWHASGMVGSVKAGTIDRPLAMTVAFVWLSSLAVLQLAWPWAELGLRLLAFLTLTLAVPFLAVAYRWNRARAPSGAAQSTILYTLYFSARAWALTEHLAASLGLRLHSSTASRDRR